MAALTAPRAPIAALLAFAAAVCVAGALLTANLIATGAPATAPPPSGPFAVGDDVPTSFGVVAVEGVQKLNGVTAKALAGANHGIQNYVPPSKVQLQAYVTLTNLSDAPVEYSPRQFAIVRQNGRLIPELSGSLRPGRLLPHASIDARLSFVAPRDGKRLSIEFKDPSRAKPIVIGLGRTSRKPAGIERSHVHP